MHDTDLERQIYSHHAAMVAERQELTETLFTTFADRVVMRVEEVLRGIPGALPLGEKEQLLLRYLLNAVGLPKALAAGLLCERLGTNPRHLKQMVHDLRLHHRVQIGASRDGEAGGYYLIATEAESIESSSQMVDQAVSMLRVVRVLRSTHTVAELLGQVRLRLEEGGQ